MAGAWVRGGKRVCRLYSQPGDDATVPPTEAGLPVSETRCSHLPQVLDAQQARQGLFTCHHQCMDAILEIKVNDGQLSLADTL